ncbi:MAG TPA: M36 family metallopeptidase, partial [Gaiellaceae bacterium]|nr:M36 family metallopeptidase [Gaiellaceae bacterium]
PNHPGIRDGDFDFAIIGHEYGHGVSNRLTGGPGINCLTGDERMGEGWSDYIGLVIPLTPELDDPQQPRGLVPYVLYQPDRHGNGLRPRPYTRDMTIQPFTYDSIKSDAWLTGSLATPHGVGHGWNSILWDMTWDLIDKHGFYANLYEGWENGGNTRSMQYVMDGLKIQGCGPSFVVGRDAIITAQEVLTDGEDTCTLWASFSRRGLGFSASDGGSTGRNDGTEAFDTHPDCRRGFTAPVKKTYGELNVVDAGSAVPLRFSDAGLTGLDILMPTNSPFSRQVDCETLAVPSVGERITPREYPIDTETPGSSGLTRSATGVYTYPWKTQEDWAGTCRELVITRLDGVQHRAFFRFVAPES